MKRFLLLFLISLIRGNIYPETKELFGAGSSLFGYNLALYTHFNGSKSILVGAPALSSAFTKMKTGGGVYSCAFKTLTCNELKIDIEGDLWRHQGTKWSMDSSQGLGATIATQGNSFITCAPLYTYVNNKNEPLPSGNCFYSYDLQNFHNYSPCKNKYCLGGFSATIFGDTIGIGGPGREVTRGAYFFNYYLIQEYISIHDYTYLGYSIAINSKIEVIGVPRADDLNGQIIVRFKYRNNNRYRLFFGAYGSYFGYSLCIVDVTGDGEENILVGAPLFSSQENDKIYDAGRIHIISLKHGRNLKIDNDEVLARFGTSIASLGDINADGVNDFAVGAPGTSTVHIFHGNSKWNFRIFKRIQKETIHSAFGFAVAGGVDLDGNGYPDFVVGDYEHNKVFIHRTQPLIHVSFKMTLTRIESDGVAKLNYQIRYWGKDVPNQQNFTLNWKLEYLRFKTSNFNKFIVLKYDKHEYVSEVVEVTSNRIGNILKVELNLELVPYQQANDFSVPPALAEKSSKFREIFHITKSCGADNKCTPNFQISFINTMTQYTYGSMQVSSLFIKVKNLGEVSFKPQIELKLPNAFSYNGVSGSFSCERDTLICDLPTLFQNSQQEFTIKVKPELKKFDAKNIEFSVEVFDESDESLKRVTDKHEIEVLVNTNLTLTGLTFPEEKLLFLPEKITHFTHRYLLINSGISPIKQINFTLEYPELFNNQPFMNLTSINGDQNTLNCNNTPVESNLTSYIFKVMNINCQASWVGSVEVDFNFQLNSSSLEKVYEGKVSISSRLNVTGVEIYEGREMLMNQNWFEVKTQLEPIPKASMTYEWGNELLIVEGSATSGTLILLGIVLGLWRVGFFKRKRAPKGESDEADEGQE